MYSARKPYEFKRGIVTKSNGNGDGSLENLSEKAYEIARRRQAAANEAVAMLEEQYETTFQSRAASLLQAAAWLAGNSLRRSFEADGGAPSELPAGAAGSDEQAKLMKAFMFLVSRYGIELKPEEYSAPVPMEQQTRLTTGDIEEAFASRYDEIMQKHGFDLADGARTGAVVCARLVKIHCANRNDLEPRVAASIVRMGFVEGETGDGREP